MRIACMVTLDSQERSVLTEALAPFRQLPDDRHWQGAQALARADQGSQSRKMLEELQTLLQELRVCLFEQTQAYAHPAWVDQTRKMREAGGHPLFLDPEGAVKMITEARVRQVSKVDEALVLLERILSLLSQCETYSKDASDAASDLPSSDLELDFDDAHV